MAVSTESRSSSTRPLSLSLLAFLLTGCDMNRLDTGDLASMRERGTVRVIMPRTGAPEVLPRMGNPLDQDRRLAERLATSLGLEPRWVFVENRAELLPALLEGRGDLVVAGLTVTPDREESVAFSTPVEHVRELVISRVSDTALTGAEALNGRTLVVRRSSSYWGTARELRASHPGLDVIEAPDDMSTEEIIYRVSQGEFDLTISDDNLAAEVLAYLPSVRVAFPVTGRRPVAWAARPDSDEFLSVVNDFIENLNLHETRPEAYYGDLPELRERKVLRVLTRNSAATYFLWRGRLLGFDYELARRFVETHDMRIEIVVPPTPSALLAWLRQGRGDLVAAGLTPLEERASLGISFSRPYNYVREMLVARPADSVMDSWHDLEGREVVVRQSSSYWKTLRSIQDLGVNFTLTAAPEAIETEELIALVAAGEHDLTVSDSHILDLELAWRDDVVGAFALTDSIPLAWAVREEDTRLLAAVDDFIRREYRGLFYNLTYNEYFRTSADNEARLPQRAAVTGQISPYDDIIQSVAPEYEFDWRLIAAQMFEESRFTPDARSFAGAVGLMQLMPRTAEGLGVDSLEDPRQSTLAGIRYLRHQYELLSDIPSPRERVWFALASYNAGYGHVQDARRLARQLGYDPDVWFDNVEAVMPLLRRREYFSRAPHGYCRCAEPVHYVRNIRDRYQAYAAIDLEESKGEADQS